MDYGIALPFIAYFAAIYAVSKFNLKPILGTFIAIGIPFAVTVIVSWIITGSNLSSIWGNIITPLSLLVLLIQFFLMFLLLRYIKNTESTVSYLVAGILGLLLVVVYVPLIIAKLF